MDRRNRSPRLPTCIKPNSIIRREYETATTATTRRLGRRIDVDSRMRRRRATIGMHFSGKGRGPLLPPPLPRLRLRWSTFSSCHRRVVDVDYHHDRDDYYDYDDEENDGPRRPSFYSYSTPRKSRHRVVVVVASSSSPAVVASDCHRGNYKRRR